MLTLRHALMLRQRQIGGMQALADHIGVHVSYLYSLLKEEKTNPGPEILEALGIKKVVTYELDETARGWDSAEVAYLADDQGAELSGALVGSSDDLRPAGAGGREPDESSPRT